MVAVHAYEPEAPTPSPLDRPPEQRGHTDISSTALAHLAEGVAQEVPGVHGVRSSGLLPVGSDDDRPGDRHIKASADVLSHRRVNLEVTAGLDYPARVRWVLDALRAHIIERVEELTGYDVARLDLEVSELRRIKPRSRVV